MIIGVPKEIKNREGRVALIPAGAKALAASGHRVIIQESAGEGSGISDAEYIEAGAEIRSAADDVYAEAELILKVKEPLPQEYPLLRENQVLFTYLHLAAAPDLTKALLERKIVGIAYETVQLDGGSLPLLTPMSEVAGKLSIQIGAHWLQGENGGSGTLLAGVPGTPPAKVVIVGGGVVGINAAKVALGMGADVTILDVNLDRLRYLADVLPGMLKVLASNELNIEKTVTGADLVIGGVLIPGRRAKKVVSRSMITKMRRGSVIVDVAIDQGGCVEGAIATSIDDPVIDIDGVLLCCIANLPACVARTSTVALTNATFPYVLKLASMGWREALESDPALARGLNVLGGKLVNQGIAESLGMEHVPYRTLDP